MPKPKKNKSEETNPKTVASKPKNDAKIVTIIGTKKGTLREGHKYTLPTKLATIFINKGFATLQD